MDKQKKIEILAEILDVEPVDINEKTYLTNMDEWDSLAILSFIVMMDEEFNKVVTGEEIKKMVTIADLLEVMK